jgi:SET domain-containing protein
LSAGRVPYRVSRAGDKGDGVFATAALPRGTTVTVFKGPSRWIWEIPKATWPHAFQDGYDRYVVPAKGGIGWSINHSCEPNCHIRDSSVVTARLVAAGEELTIDYSTDVDWEGYEMECRCGAPSCRGVVRAYRFLSATLKRRYGKNVAKFIRVRYFGDDRSRKRRRVAGARP